MTSRFSFEVVDAIHYDELRPMYAPEAVAWVAERCELGPGANVVDLAAGTGRLSGRFVELGFDVVAVEPAANMRAVLEISDRLVVLNHGEVIAEGEPRAVIREPEVVTAYLGTAHA